MSIFSCRWQKEKKKLKKTPKTTSRIRPGRDDDNDDFVIVTTASRRVHFCNDGSSDENKITMIFSCSCRYYYRWLINRRCGVDTFAGRVHVLAVHDALVRGDVDGRLLRAFIVRESERR